MSVTIYHGPTGKEETPSDASGLQGYFVSPAVNYWKQGSGDAALEVIDDGGKKELIIMPHEKYGFYLQYTEGPGTWLSLGDRRSLSHVAICLNEWRVSVGLFLPAAEAWAAVAHFFKTAQRSPQVEWITPEEIPEGGNY